MKKSQNQKVSKIVVDSSGPQSMNISRRSRSLIQAARKLWMDPTVNIVALHWLIGFLQISRIIWNSNILKCLKKLNVAIYNIYSNSQYKKIFFCRCRQSEFYPCCNTEENYRSFGTWIWKKIYWTSCEERGWRRSWWCWAKWRRNRPKAACEKFCCPWTFWQSPDLSSKNQEDSWWINL